MEPLIADWYHPVTRPYTEDGVITYEYTGALTSYRDDIEWVLDRISEVTPLEFVQVSSNAEWRFGDLTRDSQFAGYGGYAWGTSRGGWDIIFSNYHQTTPGYERYITLHEIGHALGLEHPFDATDGDQWTGAAVSDTVMAYGYRNGMVVNDYTAADWDTLTGLYGGQFVVESVEPVEEVEPVKVDEDLVSNEEEGIGERRWNKLLKKMTKGNTEKVVTWLDREGYIADAELAVRLRRNTFTLEEEADIMSHVINKDWQAIGQTRYFTPHNPNAAQCPCCTK